MLAEPRLRLESGFDLNNELGRGEVRSDSTRSHTVASDEKTGVIVGSCDRIKVDLADILGFGF